MMHGSHRWCRVPTTLPRTSCARAQRRCQPVEIPTENGRIGTEPAWRRLPRAHPTVFVRPACWCTTHRMGGFDSLAAPRRPPAIAAPVGQPGPSPSERWRARQERAPVHGEGSSPVTSAAQSPTRVLEERRRLLRRRSSRGAASSAPTQRTSFVPRRAGARILPSSAIDTQSGRARRCRAFARTWAFNCSACQQTGDVATP